MNRFFARCVLFATVCSSACSGSGSGAAQSTDTDGDTDTDAGAGPGEVLDRNLALSRKVSWPGGGRELHIKIVDAAGSTVVSDLSAGLSIDIPQSTLAARRLALDPGYTGVLIAVPEAGPQQLQLVEELKAFVGARPKDETLALFLWRDTIEQLGGFNQSRRHLLSQLDLLPSFPAPASMLPANEAMLAIADEVRSVAGRAPEQVMRAAVVVGASAVTVPAEASGVPFIVGLNFAGDRIDRLAEQAYYRVAVCADPAAVQGNLAEEGASQALLVSLPDSVVEQAESTCDVAQVNSGERNFPETLEMVFDAAQLATYTQVLAQLSKADFELSVKVGDAGLAVGRAHLRGNSTLSCPRHSYTLQLDGAGRHFMPNSRTDEFYLISMCQDDRYIQQYTANQLMTELGLFGIKFRYIELKIDGQSQGVYLLLEKMREELVRDNSRVQGVMRRRVGSFEVKWGDVSTGFQSLYQSATQNAGIAAQYIDLDQYFEFLALMTAYENGDYVDEVFIVAVEQATPDGLGTSWFTMSAWDNDDLFSECHFGGANAYPDPNGLVYCAESEIDQVLLSDPAMYARYVDALEGVLQGKVTPARFDEAVARTGEALLPYLAKPGVSAAMVELITENPGASDPTVAQQDVQARLDSMASTYRARHQLLLDRIAAYRAQ